MSDQKWFTNMPWGIVGIVAVIALIGLTAVYSATYTAKGPSTLFSKQLVWVAMGLMMMLLVLLADYHTVSRYAYVLYAFSIVLLLLVMVMGKTGMGAQRWLALGPIAFQPSELMKLPLARSHDLCHVTMQIVVSALPVVALSPVAMVLL